MSHSTRFSFLDLLIAAALVGGCDAPAESTARRSASGDEASEDADAGGAGGGYVPNPACSFDCLSASGVETVCIESCDDGCKTVVVERDVRTNGSVDIDGSSYVFCPEQFPEPELWARTCDLYFGESQPSELGCNATFSDAACSIAFDLCLPDAP